MPVTNTLLSGDHAVDRVQHNSAILTPEATAAIIDRAVPGIPEAMRAESMKITPHGILSRGIAGIRKRTLIINLPGSPKSGKRKPFLHSARLESRAFENMHTPSLKSALQFYCRDR